MLCLRQTTQYSKADNISAAAFNNDVMADKALRTFFELLGGFAGDCALTLGATGGVYIGLAWFIAVVSMFRIRRLHPDEPTPYRVRHHWAPATGGVAALILIAATLIPGTAVSLVWPQEYLILFGWALAGVFLYQLVPQDTI